MMFPAPLRQSPLPLPQRRVALLARISAERDVTSEAGRRLVADLRASERMRASLMVGFKVLKASLAAGSVIWSLNALSHRSRMGRGGRVVTVAVSLLSTIRTVRRVGKILMPLVLRVPPLTPKPLATTPGR